MSGNKLVIKVIGSTLIVPTKAVFQLTQKSIEIYAPNFKYVLNRANIQDIDLLAPTTASESERELVNLLFPEAASRNDKNSSHNSRNDHQESKKKQKPKEIKLTSGMI